MLQGCQVNDQAGLTNSIDADNLYFAHHPAIERAIRSVCRRHRLAAVDAEDFASEARIHLMEDDFAALRRFQGRSSFSTYILTVVTHFGHDWRNARWGKWRPSAAARRQGRIVAHLEQLTRRNGLTFEEAYETLRTNHSVTMSRADLEAVVATLPTLTRRRFVPDDQLDDRPATGPTPYALIDRRAAAAAAQEAVGLLAQAVAALPAEDVLVLKLRFGDGLRVVEIAQALQLEQKPLYRRIARLLGQLRTELEWQGLAVDTVRDLLVREGFADVENPSMQRAFRLFPPQLLLDCASHH
jgi:RNA polymerase sigma factor for flagellar operon FliA